MTTLKEVTMTGEKMMTRFECDRLSETKNNHAPTA
jgi:hypothetical protein